MIERIPSSTGIKPATTAPNTSTSTMSATGNPNPSSPWARSFDDWVVKSFPTV